MSEHTPQEIEALQQLSTAVFPPEVVASLPGRDIEWSRRQWNVLIWNADQTRVWTRAGIVVRNALLNGQNVKIGGIGGVMTHPEHRQQGSATAAIARCLQFFREAGDIDLALLVCEPRLLGFYTRRGWREFPGELLVTQQGHVETFTFNRVMTVPLRLETEPTGSIDLLGPPW